MMPENEQSRLSKEQLQWVIEAGGLWSTARQDSDLGQMPEPYCGVYWIITTCLTGIALGLGFGVLAWLVLA